MAILAAVTTTDVALFSILLLVVFLFFFALCCWGVWLTRIPDSVSPYSRQPMRRGSDISYDAALKVLKFLYNKRQYDNRIFGLKKAAICRETGRIFPNAVTWYGKIKVDWSFLNKRFPGRYVSWGSLTYEQQEIIRLSHGSLALFQTDHSSPRYSPAAVEAEYAFLKPGPLYVDLENNILLGWQCVPDTDLEVLIVQKPLKIITPTIT